MRPVPISYKNTHAAITSVDYSSDRVSFSIKNGWMEAIYGKRSLAFIVIKSNCETVFFSGLLPNKTSSFEFISENENKTISAQFTGNRRNGKVTFAFKDLLSFKGFYIHWDQPFGNYEETETFYLNPKLPYELPISKTVALIPCYNVSKLCSKVIHQTLSYVKQIVLVDDGSTDNTLEVLKEIQKENSERITLIEMERNLGKGSALLKGFNYALEKLSFDQLITLDSDQQHDPEHIPQLAYSIKDGNDVAIGSRLFHRMPLRSRFGNHIITLLLKKYYPHSPTDTQSGYRAFSFKTLKGIVQNIHSGGYETEFECLLYALKNCHRIRAIPVSTIYIDGNASSAFSAVKDSLKILKVLFKDEKPSKEKSCSH